MGGRLDWPRGAAALVGSTARAVDRGGGAGSTGPPWTGGAGRDRARQRRGPRRRRHGRGALARRGGATGLGESRRGHRRDAHVEAISMRVLAT